MESIGKALNRFLNNSNKPKSRRSYLIQSICDTLFTQSDFIKILGQTKEFTENEIEEIFLKSKNWDINPQALFWKLVKEKKEEIKESLDKEIIEE